MHEASMHEENSFITLTYADEHLPADLSLNVGHYQKFMKRLRARLTTRVKFFHCGEYGDEEDEFGIPTGFLGRPHYHAIIFGYGFPDREYWKTVNEQRLYTSEFLADVWGNGFIVIGDVSFESCAYVARYVCKKINGELAHDHYMVLDERTGAINPVKPEYATMSRGGRDGKGIGHSWYEKYSGEVLHNDSVVMNAREMKPPKYYEALFDELELEAIKALASNTEKLLALIFLTPW